MVDNIFFCIKKPLLLLILCSLLSVNWVNAQDELSWEALADVTFEKQFDKETNAYWLIPVFGQQPRTNEGKTVIIEGYFIPVDMDSDFYVLSQFPYASCFFCGGAGPESVVELQMEKKKANKLRLDQRVRIQGIFQTNDSDFDHCNYILNDAKPLKN